MKRGEIYWTNLNPTIGSEIAKTRLAIIVSNDINNEFSNTITILPITSSTAKIYPFEVLLNKGEGNLQNDSKVKANQIRTIDKQRLIGKIGKISITKMHDIDHALLLHLDIKI